VIIKKAILRLLRTLLTPLSSDVSSESKATINAELSHPVRAVNLGVAGDFVVLSKTGINLQTGATINGRMLARTAVTLQMSAVAFPQ
jgi:hypothetical protein